MSGKTASAYMPVGILKPGGLTQTEEALYNAQLVCNNLGMGIASSGFFPMRYPIGATVLTATYYAFVKKSPTAFGNIDIPVVGEVARMAYWTPALLIAFNVPGAVPGMLMGAF